MLNPSCLLSRHCLERTLRRQMRLSQVLELPFGLRRMLLKKYALAFSLTIQSFKPHSLPRYANFMKTWLWKRKSRMKSCIANVNVLLSDITESRDSLTTITVRKRLAEKHRPIFAILNGHEGVLEFFVTPK